LDLQKPDEELVLEYQRGSSEALEEIFQRYKKPILNYSLRVLGHRADAEDVTTEIFMTILTNKFAYQPQAKFSTWLYTVARNACVTRLRRRRHIVSIWFTKTEEQEVEEWDIPDTKDLPREELIKKETARAVRQVIAKMSGLQKEALILREYQKLSYKEIAEILNCSTENVKILLFRAREQLRNELPPLIWEGQND
jgi:RNA polymerase sigma-70 factor, ECF subfamily